MTGIGHARALELAAAAIDFGLGPDDGPALDAHLAACASCRATATALRRDAVSLQRAIDHGMPTERVLQAVVVAARRPPRRARASAWLPLAAALALVVGVTGGLVAGGALESIRLPSGIDPATIAWSRIADERAFPSGDGISSIIAIAPVPGASGHLLAGGISSGSARLWLSADGTTWEPVADQGDSFERGRIEAVAASGAGLVAVGKRTDDRGLDTGVVWTSTDGRDWKVVALDQASKLTAVAAAPQRFVAAGVGRSDAGLPVWFSTDGVNWAGVPSEPFTAASVTGVVTGGPGFVAVGFDDRAGAVWTSVDGVIWTRTDDTSTFQRSRIQAVAPTAAGLVAVGWQTDVDQTSVPVAWTSADGVRWERHVVDEAAQGTQLKAVAATAYGIIAVGRATDGAAGWVSSDGRAWRRLPAASWAGGTELLTVGRYQEHVLAGGGADGAAAMWVGDQP